MKIFILIAVFLSSISSFAGNPVPYYCKDKPTVIYITVNLDATTSQHLSINAVSFGKLIANLSDGTSVIAPCDSYGSNSAVKRADIVDQSKVFTLVNVKSKKDGKTESQIVGINLKTSTLLKKETILKILKSYYIQHSDYLEKLKK